MPIGQQQNSEPSTSPKTLPPTYKSPPAYGEAVKRDPSPSGSHGLVSYACHTAKPELSKVTVHFVSQFLFSAEFNLCLSFDPCPRVFPVSSWSGVTLQLFLMVVHFNFASFFFHFHLSIAENFIALYLTVVLGDEALWMSRGHQWNFFFNVLLWAKP